MTPIIFQEGEDGFIVAHNCGKIELSLAFYSQHGTLKVGENAFSVSVLKVQIPLSPLFWVGLCSIDLTIILLPLSVYKVFSMQYTYIQYPAV